MKYCAVCAVFAVLAEFVVARDTDGSSPRCVKAKGFTVCLVLKYVHPKGYIWCLGIGYFTCQKL